MSTLDQNSGNNRIGMTKMGEECPARAVLRWWCVEASGGTNKCCESSRLVEVVMLMSCPDSRKVRSEQGLVWADEILLKMDREGRGRTKDCAEVQDFAERHSEIGQQTSTGQRCQRATELKS